MSFIDDMNDEELRDEFPPERNRDCNGRYCGERDCPTCSPPEPEDEEEPLSVDQVHNLLQIGIEMRTEFCAFQTAEAIESTRRNCSPNLASNRSEVPKDE